MTTHRDVMDDTPAKPVTLSGRPEPAPGTVDWEAPVGRQVAQARLEAELDRAARNRDTNVALARHQADAAAAQQAAEHARIRREVATAVLAGMASAPIDGDGVAVIDGDGVAVIDFDVSRAVRYADALLAELERTGGAS